MIVSKSVVIVRGKNIAMLVSIIVTIAVKLYAWIARNNALSVKKLCALGAVHYLVKTAKLFYVCMMNPKWRKYHVWSATKSIAHTVFNSKTFRNAKIAKATLACAMIAVLYIKMGYRISSMSVKSAWKNSA